MKQRPFLSEPGLFIAVAEFPPGWMGLAASPAGVVRCTLPQQGRAAALAELGLGHVSPGSVDPLIQRLVGQLERYFKGERPDLSFPLEFASASVFEKQVWLATRTIPHAETRSYAWIAREIGKPQAARAVGQALGRNPLPILIPCHRVLTSDGRLGGFGGGLAMKRYLLDIERRAR